MVMARDCTTIKDNFENALQVVSIIQHFPNLPIFIVEQPLKGSFGPVADALVKLMPLEVFVTSYSTLERNG